MLDHGHGVTELIITVYSHSFLSSIDVKVGEKYAR